MNCKDSVLWEYAETEFKKLPLNEKVLRYAQVMQLPCRTEEDKIAVIMQLPNRVELICEHISDREAEVVTLLSWGYSYNEVCKELGYASRSSIRIIIKNIRVKLLEVLNG